tara:strand:- start:167 stop:532 length:366 start_codon:yes stop_codon:yes gene_type:complete
MPVATGEAQFINLKSKEIYNGKETDYYTMVLTLDEDSVEQLRSANVPLKEYEGRFQRKFKSQTSPRLYELNNDEFIGDITRGSKVRVQYSLGQEHPVHGFAPWFSKIRVLELAAGDTEEDF